MMSATGIAHGARKVLFVGPPGSGATLRARELAKALPVEPAEAADAYYMRLQAGLPATPESGAPFRAPHHSVSRGGMQGMLRRFRWTPGEMNLAHGGVLYLDEAPRFSQQVLGDVEQVLETGYVELAHNYRLSGAPELNRIVSPARFVLVMSMAPCVCGWHGVEGEQCRCTERQVARWQDAIASLSRGAERIVLRQRDLSPSTGD